MPDPLGPLSLSQPQYSPIAADYDLPAAPDSDRQPIRRRFPLSYHAASVANVRSALRFPRSLAWTPSGVSWDDEAGRLLTHQLQLTIADLVVEIHDTHHPVSGWLYFEEQRPSARRRTRDFWRYRVPKFLGYFERVLHTNGGQYLIGRRLSYVDLSLFQIIEGLRYAFPKRMKRFEKKIPGVVALHDRVARRPRVKAYLASKRRIAFSQWGIYRYFKELDG